VYVVALEFPDGHDKKIYHPKPPPSSLINDVVSSLNERNDRNTTRRKAGGPSLDDNIPHSSKDPLAMTVPVLRRI